eukprot:9337235-Pyramimonas_sp.AAC.1
MYFRTLFKIDGDITELSLTYQDLPENQREAFQVRSTIKAICDLCRFENKDADLKMRAPSAKRCC